MSIVEAIKKARDRGVSDTEIIQEIKKQNPEKADSLKKAQTRGASPSEILEEIIKQNAPEERAEKSREEAEIERARERIEALKKKAREKAPQEPPKEEGPPEEGPPEEPEEKPVKKAPLRETEPEPARKTLHRKSQELLIGRRPESEGPKKEKVKPQIKKERQKPAPQKPIRMIRPLPQKPSWHQKIWVRVLIFGLVLVLLAGLSTFWYWYLVIRKEPPPISPETAEEEGEEIEEESPEEDAPVIPASLFATEEKRIFNIAELDEVSPLLKQTLTEKEERGEFKRIAIKKGEEIIALKELIDSLQIRINNNSFYENLEEDFTLFIYSQIEGNRIGFAVRTKNSEEIESFMRDKEASMKEDFQPFFNLIMEDQAPIAHYFKNSSNVVGYQGPNFRFQTLARNDIGICYLVSDNYFVFTSSWQSMKAVIERLNIAGEKIEITSDLKINDRGYEVEILQTWLAEDATIYPSGAVNGWFGPQTKEAVIRFQEKHASDILAPQGLSEGTGEVDLYTRIKLNEIYGTSGAIPPHPEITRDLKFGDSGDQVRLLQTWLAEDVAVYPRGIVSGWFGPLTKEAVIRFQEKYASDILAPQGLSEGTGILDGYTRRKLNNLYGE
jgi:peptidoglycan hydrolase-like protein with peptidoglycan-binding domain